VSDGGNGDSPGPPGASEAFFDTIAGRYERAYALPATESRRRMERVIAALPAPPARILDLGVGTGRELTALLDAGHEPTGVDVSRAMLERCSRRARPVPLVRADFWQTPLPFGDGAFDAAVALHGTLAHPPDVDAIARLGHELARVVAPGGALVVEAPSPGWVDRLASLPPQPDRRVRRTGPRTCVYEDLVTGASIEAVALTADEWRSALGPPWRAEVDAIDELEWLVVARRR
jgi:SAM-dependent methyltransferase